MEGCVIPNRVLQITKNIKYVIIVNPKTHFIIIKEDSQEASVILILLLFLIQKIWIIKMCSQ